MSDQVQAARELRNRLLQDRHRPAYHVIAPEGLCGPFDPNAAIFWKGRYHLMYIMQTEKGHCWAHVSSTDLVHWRHHSLALEPGGGDTGIYSGGAFVDMNGTPTITYWGLGDEGGICLATSTDDDLENWTKCPDNPVILQQEFGLSVGEDGQPYGVADPSQIWIRDGRYYLMTGNLLVLNKYGRGEEAIEEHKGDTTYLFVSDDLINWEYLHPFYESDRRWTDESEDDMCPDFFPLGDRHMLLFISHNLGCQYYIGRYEDDHFYPELHERMTWVDASFFAPESLGDDKGRRIMWAWIHDCRSRESCEANGWSGTMSLPRVLSLGDDKTLRMAPPEELELLRYNPREPVSVTVPADGQVSLDDACGDTIELEIEMTADDAVQYGVVVCRSAGGEEQTEVYYDATEKKLKIDTTRSSLGTEGPKSVEAGPLALAPGEPLRLRVFVDRSVVEVFANDRQAVTRRIYTTREDSVGVALFSRGGAAEVRSAAWDMAPANPW